MMRPLQSLLGSDTVSSPADTYLDLAHLVHCTTVSLHSMNALGLLRCVQLFSGVLNQHSRLLPPCHCPPPSSAPALSILVWVLSAMCRFLRKKELVQHRTLRNRASDLLNATDSSSRTHFDSVSLLLELGVGGDLWAVELLEHVEHALQTAGVRLPRGDDRSKGLGAALEAISGKDHLPQRLYPHAQANTNFRDLLSSPCSGSGKRLNREEELLPLGAELSGLALPLPQLRRRRSAVKGCRGAESTVRLELPAEELRPTPQSPRDRVWLIYTSCTRSLSVGPCAFAGTLGRRSPATSRALAANRA